jgi:hypothetical protein
VTPPMQATQTAGDVNPDVPSGKVATAIRHALKRRRVTQASLHPIQIGQVVAVLRLPTARPPFIEGRAVIKGNAKGPHFYRIQFAGDPRICERFVHPAYQKNPDAALAWLVELWVASLRPDHDEFFPDDAIGGDGAPS